jgi:hypothetical protein
MSFDPKKIIPAVAAIAPTIAGLLGGPLASMGVQALEGVFGLAAGTADSDPQQLIKAVANISPDTAIKLAQIDSDLKTKLAQAGIDMEALQVKDRDSARTREAATKDWTPRVLALVIICGYAMVQWYIMSHVLAAEMREVVMRSLGVLDAAVGMVLTYYYGSSSSSKTKDETISKLSS